MKQTIECEGRVDAVSKDMAEVVLRASDDGACHGCAAAMLCGRNDVGGAIKATVAVDVVVTPGDRVKVNCTEAARGKSILFCLVIPALLLMTGVFGATIVGASEAMAALAGVVLPCVWFGALYVARLYGVEIDKNVWKITEVVK